MFVVAEKYEGYIISVALFQTEEEARAIIEDTIKDQGYDRDSSMLFLFPIVETGKWSENDLFTWTDQNELLKKYHPDQASFYEES